MIHLLHADCREALQSVAPNTVQCVVTSPPYWGLRDYGHDAQLGLEPSPAEYLARMVDVFDLVRRALRPDGTLWLNMGDSYIGRRCGGVGANSSINGTRSQEATREAQAARGGSVRTRGASRTAQQAHRSSWRPEGLKYKDLVGMPWRLALALQAAGWWLRADIVWHKPNPMPESVTDRPTKSHEYVFLLSKSDRYHFDAAAIAEPVSGTANGRGVGVNPKADGRIPRGWDTGPGGHRGLVGNYTPKDKAREEAGLRPAARMGRGPGLRSRQNASFSGAVNGLVDQRNARSVWTISTQPFGGAHFATFPEELARRCILAGSRPGDLVLDPFAGSGTVGAVCARFGRRALLIEASDEYVELAARRCDEAARDSSLELFGMASPVIRVDRLTTKAVAS